MFLRPKSNNETYTIDVERKNNNNRISLFPFDSKSFQNKKFKKEFLLLKSINSIKEVKNNDEKSNSPTNSICILGKNCPYYKKYLNLKKELTILLSSIIKVKDFNHSLLNSLSKRTSLYYNLISENEDLKKSLHRIKSKKIFNYQNNGQDNSIFYEKNENFKKSDRTNKSFLFKILKNKNRSLTENNFLIKKQNNPLNNSQFSRKLLLNTSNTNLNNFIYKENTKNNLKNKTISGNIRKSILAINSDPNKHYEILHNYSKQQNQKLIGDSSKFSFLSSNMDYDDISKNNQTLISLEKLTKNDENFLRTIADSSNEILLKYCDMIISLINDYKEMIKLGIKMKDFIRGSNRFVDSVMDNNPSKILIENTCSILNCDRASLFILDKTSDSLIVYLGEGVKKAQIKVPKDKGIVGACFLEAKKLRIDDAYLDKRFNKEVDKKTNYRTKSILCYPLIDKDGECFGVIEAINKLNSPFNEDDEEFLKILAYQASIIFRGLSSNDNYKFLNLKLNLIVDYDIEISYIKNKFEFSEKTEDTLLNLFDCIEAAFYFVEDNMIKRYKDNKIQKYDINVGIIGKAIKLKQILTFRNIKNCAEYNSIIDMNTSDRLLTFPILGKKDKIVRAVVQVPYIGKVYQNDKPNENEIKVIKKFRKCIKNWIQINILQK